MGEKTRILIFSMVDMLVRLYSLPEGAPLRRELQERGILIRRCNPYELHLLEEWVGHHFSPKWVSECRVAMSHQPVGCVIATSESRIVGFACFDTTARGFIGPMGVEPSQRGSGVGKALLITALEQMRALGYAYAIVGGVGPQEFYARTVGATPIEGSSPGIYANILPDFPPSSR